MDLLSVLNSNGTGLLEGFCRLQNDHFSFNPRLAYLKPKEKVRMFFSFGVEYLGLYEVIIDSNFNEELNCTLVKESTKDPEVNIKIMITCCDDDFGKFLAISSNR